MPGLYDIGRKSCVRDFSPMLLFDQ